MSKINESSLENISCDQIDIDIMSVLYANQDIKFSPAVLFNKVLYDRYNMSIIDEIHQNFKSKFLLVLRLLESRYDDVKIIKQNENYWIICKSENNVQIEYPVYNIPIGRLSDFTSSDYILMYGYIFTNNLDEQINWINPSDGNSIYHELVLTNDKNLIQTLVNLNKFNFDITNKYDQTPLDISQSQEILNILVKGLRNKIKLLEEKIILSQISLQNQINEFRSQEYKNNIILNASIFNIIKTKLPYINNYYKFVMLVGLILYIGINI